MSSVQDVYAANLQQPYGYPLYSPAPRKQLPEPYPSNGFEVGDVGYVNREGEFIPLFNIRLSPLVQSNVPSYEPVQIGEPYCKPLALPKGHVIMSGVQQDAGALSSASYSFVAKSNSGAILILPSGATFTVLKKKDLETFRQIAFKYARDWCQIWRHDSLFLIVGLYKTRHFTLASFDNGHPGGKLLVEQQHTGTYKWMCEFGTNFRTGPQDNHYENQTVLIKGFRMTVRWSLLSVIEKVTRINGWLYGTSESLVSTIFSYLPSQIGNTDDTHYGSASCATIENLQIVITHIRAENLVTGLGRVPVGFYAQVDVPGRPSMRTENKSISVCDRVVQWDDLIHLPLDSSTIKLMVFASFEFEPMLGRGELLHTLETSVGELLHRTHPFTFSDKQGEDGLPCASFFVSVQERRYDHRPPGSNGAKDIMAREESIWLAQITQETDDGHDALLRYHKDRCEENLKCSVTHFERALAYCPDETPHRAVALFNLATAKFMTYQTEGTSPDFDASVSLYRKALELRRGDHRDRPMTLLHLAQAILYRYRIEKYEVSTDELCELVDELKSICAEGTHTRRAADLVLQTYECLRLMDSDDVDKLTDLISKLDAAAQEPPDAYFDRPIRFNNFGLALQRGFQLHREAGFGDLDKAIEWFEKAVRITSDSHPSKSRYVSDLGSAYLRRCRALYDKGHIVDAVASFLEVAGTIIKEAKADETLVHRLFRFAKRCNTTLKGLGDEAFDSEMYDKAIKTYTTALSLGTIPSFCPDDHTETLIKRSNARAALSLWEDALIDADEATRLDPSSYKGHEMRHAALHGLKRYTEAVEAFDTMLSKLACSPDEGIRKLQDRYVDARPTIRHIIERTIRLLPLVLIDTSTGRLYDKAQQAKEFEALPIYSELVSSMTTERDDTRLWREITKFYEYAMLSHKWQQDESLFQDVGHTSVYELRPSSGNTKLQKFCSMARSFGFRWAWCDTCCVDRVNKVVLEASLVAMFDWYRGSALTLIHLFGVSSQSNKVSIKDSVWNTRAWTYQEYLAANRVLFYTEDWKPYLGLKLSNHKDSPIILSEMEQFSQPSTGQSAILRPGLSRVREKLYLASMRNATFEEDIAYSLFGIFNAAIPIMYGEGNRAVGRLLEYILTGSADITILAWTGTANRYNSCLPMDLTVYNQFIPPHLPPPMEIAKVDQMVAELRASTPDLSLVTKLYEQLNALPPPFLASSRLRLPGIVFLIDKVICVSEPDPQTKLGLYRATTTMFGEVDIVTVDDLRAIDDLYLVHPWIRPLLDQESRRGSARPDKMTRAFQLVARLMQPFGALLLEEVSRAEYKRVAADGLIMVQIRQDVLLDDLIENINTIDVQ